MKQENPLIEKTIFCVTLAVMAGMITAVLLIAGRGSGGNERKDTGVDHLAPVSMPTVSSLARRPHEP